MVEEAAALLRLPELREASRFGEFRFPVERSARSRN